MYLLKKPTRMEAGELNVAVVQANLLWENIDGNISRLSGIIDTLQDKPNILILPEMFTTGFSMNAQHLAEEPNGETYRWMLKTSKEKGFAMCGSFIVREGNKFFNRFHFVTPNGSLFIYDKRHLFSYADEHKTFTPGQHRIVFEYMGWRIMPQICYDVRFPVWTRNRGDYDLLINVASFPAKRRRIWSTLLKARAIENQCYVAASNRVGEDGLGHYYTGDSMLINTVGEPIADILPGAEGIIQSNLSMAELIEFRKQFPVLLDADEYRLAEES